MMAARCLATGLALTATFGLSPELTLEVKSDVEEVVRYHVKYFLPKNTHTHVESCPYKELFDAIRSGADLGKSDYERLSAVTKESIDRNVSELDCPACRKMLTARRKRDEKIMDIMRKIDENGEKNNEDKRTVRRQKINVVGFMGYRCRKEIASRRERELGFCGEYNFDAKGDYCEQIYPLMNFVRIRLRNGDKTPVGLEGSYIGERGYRIDKPFIIGFDINICV